MLIPLKDIELYFDEELLEQAESLRNEGCVRSIREVEKNLWVAYIEKGEIFEIEAVLSQQKIKAFTCECADFKKKHICTHSICMLLALREQKMIHQLNGASKIRIKKEIPDKENLKDILKSAKLDELAEFVAEYAKKDPKLALLLRSRFISTIGIKDPVLTYRTLIESASKPLYQPAATSNSTASLHLKALMMQLFKNAEQEVRNANPQEAFAIIISVYAELVKLYTKRIFPRLYAPLVHKTIQFITGLYEQQPTTELKNQLWDHCFPFKVLFLYEFHCLEEFFTRLVLPLSHDLHQENVLISFLDKQIESFRNQPELNNQLVVFKMMVAFQSGDNNLLDQLLSDHSDSVSLLYFSGKKAYENQQLELAGTLLRKTINNGATGEVLDEIEEILFRIAIQLNDLPFIYIYGQKRLMATLDPAYYLSLKDHQCGTDFLGKIAAELENMPALKSRNHCLARIYFYEKNLEKLKNLVFSIQSLDLLMQYDNHLHISEDELLKTYKDFIRHYLHQHIGRQASHRIILVVTHLKGTARLSMAKEILSMLILEYPERHTLMEELENIV